MATPFERLSGLNIATLIEEAVKTLNPEKGLTHEEMVSFVCLRLGFEDDMIQSNVNDILLDGTESGALLKTDGKGYVINDDMRPLTVNAGKKKQAVRMRKYSRRLRSSRKR